MNENKGPDDVQILLLVKFPQEGEVKSRLSEEVGEELAAELYRAFVQDTLATLDASGLRHAISFHPPEAGDQVKGWLGDRYEYYPQRGDGPASRVKNTFLDAFARGEEKVIVMASDAPDIPEDMLKEAVMGLGEKDSVLGPAVDGGYNLIGFNRASFLEAAFDDISWGTAMAFADTAERMKGLSIYVTAPWPDIDTANDLRATFREKRNSSFMASSKTVEILAGTEYAKREVVRR